MAIYDLKTDVWGYPYPETKLRFEGAFSALLNQAQERYEAARKANEQRYLDILRGYRERYEQAMKLLEGLGSQAKSDILKRVLATQNAVIADLIQRGLGNSTILPSIKAGYQREAEDAIGRLEESLREQRLATHGQLSGDVLGFMERRRDEYPNLAQIYDVVFRASQPKYVPSGGSNAPPNSMGGFMTMPAASDFGMGRFPIQRAWMGGRGGMFSGAGGMFSSGIVGRRYIPGYFVGRGYTPSYEVRGYSPLYGRYGTEQLALYDANFVPFNQRFGGYNPSYNPYMGGFNPYTPGFLQYSPIGGYSFGGGYGPRY